MSAFVGYACPCLYVFLCMPVPLNTWMCLNVYCMNVGNVDLYMRLTQFDVILHFVSLCIAQTSVLIPTYFKVGASPRLH